MRLFPQSNNLVDTEKLSHLEALSHVARRLGTGDDQDRNEILYIIRRTEDGGTRIPRPLR